MKTEEDEAFDDLAKKQGSWGGGFQAKRAAAADKVQEYDQTALELCNVCGWKTLIPDDGCLNCERAQPPQRPWVGLTDEEIHRTTILMGFNPEWKTEIGIAHSIVRNLETKLKGKNNGT